MRRHLRVPCTARRPNQWILKEISPEYSLEGLMMKRKLQYFGHLMGRADSLEKPLMLGKIEGKREKGATEDEMVGWHHWLNGREFEQTLEDSEGQGSLMCCSHGFSKSQTWVSNWTTIATTTIGNYRPGTTKNVQHSYVFLFGIYYFPIETYSKIFNLKKVCVFGNSN